jgi:hypothetical protein
MFCSIIVGLHYYCRDILAYRGLDSIMISEMYKGNLIGRDMDIGDIRNIVGRGRVKVL